MNILPLADHPDCIPTLARWFHDEWSGFDGRSVEVIAQQLQANLNHDRIPITFLAMRGAELLGTISIELSDLPPRDDLSPWLASLFVAPSARRQGVGTALCHHVLQFAMEHGIPELHLWTPGSPAFYLRQGWRVTENLLYAGQPISLMRRAIQGVRQDT